MALAPLSEAGASGLTVAVFLVSAAAMLVMRPARGLSAWIWLCLLGLVCAAVGFIAGAARLRAIDAGAYAADPGTHATVRAYVAAVPRRTGGMVRVRVQARRGSLAIEAPEPVPDLAIGDEVSAAGTIKPPPPWLEDNLRLHGISRILRAGRIAPTGRRRGGTWGRIDALRNAAEIALGKGMPAPQTALARGFVLGEDDRIPAPTIEAFQRSGLAHLLAVSGQNVVLLALLATPLLAALGLPLRSRLLWLLALIALYVPLAGGGASIQRAAAMGAAGIVATLAGRPASRAYALLLAAGLTLLLNPRATADVGWQLSFAAVVGIFLWAEPLRTFVLARLGEGGWRRGLADGLAITTAATLATAPLMADHFEAVSITSLAANLLALPAVAPAMWLGMAVAALGQIPAIPVEPLNWVNSLLLAYIGQVAFWAAAPSWAQVRAPAAGWAGVFGAYAILVAAGLGTRRWIAGREAMRARHHHPGHRTGRVRPRIGLGLAVVAAAALLLLAASGLGAKGGLAGSGGDARIPGLRVSVLDVGQGDSIVLEPRGGPGVLVDGGPPGDDLRRRLTELGIASLGIAIVTHDQADHAGGVEELLGSFPVHRLGYAEVGKALIAAARASGAMPTRLAAGQEMRCGSLRLEVLWPPHELLGVGGDNPNVHSLVLLARWHEFEMLLTGDAEAEAVPIDPGPIDVLKVAHHGSADPGLGELLDRTAPRLAVISVGADNPYGHPDPTTLATLSRHGVAVLRTDRAGAVTITVHGSRSEVQTTG